MTENTTIWCEELGVRIFVGYCAVRCEDQCKEYLERIQEDETRTDNNE
ncbi:MAG: hypothetical protein GF388_01795 [Candidatus Aegiribacteria sp.]|nr:hypothetical protein [Candidatus Aegiribacteria sp.]